MLLHVLHAKQGPSALSLLLPAAAAAAASARLPFPGDHGEGRVLAVLALDRGDKSLSTPEDSLPVGKLGTSLSRPCHTLPCRSSLIGPALWRAHTLLLSPPAEAQISLAVEPARAGAERGRGGNSDAKFARFQGEVGNFH